MKQATPEDVASFRAFNRELWRPEFETEHVEVDGQEWPVIVVHKFEVNRIGERRWVATATISPENLRKSAKAA